ncbi:hypothetical protein N869_03955 [Cellulomonas bogoriensis 69B4 = DSM 16987]|uniref:ABC transporter domain-containing protein n=2 Tax=Cellulomonas bogoriensis TaxID=301388 RepID=A0A0A0C425_9CELL|nr:hypothetical protein N869_03955 [Cellulomonas bogoriensis 69B4 = DSM 16987]
MAKRFANKTLWSDLSFEIPSAAMTVVRGPSGSGKTTLLNCVGLLEPFDRGTVAFGGWSFTAGSRSASRRCFRDVLGFLFQNYGLVESWNVRRNLQVPLRIRPGSRNGGRHAMAEALERVGMRGSEKEMIYTLSGGEQQRIALARLMLKSPSVVLADEPTSALDKANADLVMSILAEEARHGALVLISTHSDEIAARCDHALTLDARPSNEERGTPGPQRTEPPTTVRRSDAEVDGRAPWTASIASTVRDQGN